jgi:hypothetical protein
MSGSRYAPTQLMLVEWGDAGFHRGMPPHTDLEEGGRLSKAKIARHAAAIDKYFDDIPVSSLIDFDGTVVWE